MTLPATSRRELGPPRWGESFRKSTHRGHVVRFFGFVDFFVVMRHPRFVWLEVHVSPQHLSGHETFSTYTTPEWFIFVRCTRGELKRWVNISAVFLQTFPQCSQVRLEKSLVFYHKTFRDYHEYCQCAHVWVFKLDRDARSSTAF